jgi:uncharacterized NAD-dependent epimerase/dehydratase family protein
MRKAELEAARAAIAEPLDLSDPRWEVVDEPAAQPGAKVVLSVRVDVEDVVILEAAANTRGVKMSAVLRDIVAEWAARQRDEAVQPVTVSPEALHAAIDRVLAAGRRAA